MRVLGRGVVPRVYPLRDRNGLSIRSVMLRMLLQVLRNGNRNGNMLQARLLRNTRLPLRRTGSLAKPRWRGKCLFEIGGNYAMEHTSTRKTQEICIIDL